jgi:hypothetical protein
VFFEVVNYIRKILEDSVSERPTLTLGLKRQDFLEYYYLKEELVKFCHDNGLPASGGKQELTERIAYYLDRATSICSKIL